MCIRDSDISGNYIGDAGAAQLAPALARLTALQRLELEAARGNGVSATGEAALREALPASVWNAVR